MAENASSSLLCVCVCVCMNGRCYLEWCDINYCSHLKSKIIFRSLLSHATWIQYGCTVDNKTKQNTHTHHHTYPHSSPFPTFYFIPALNSDYPSHGWVLYTWHFEICLHVYSILYITYIIYNIFFWLTALVILYIYNLKYIKSLFNLSISIYRLANII